MSTTRRHKRSIILRALLIIILVTAGVVGGIVAGTLRSVPAWDADKLYGQEGSQILDRNGKMVYNLHAQEDRTLVPYEKIPQQLINAFVATEDDKFYSHHGVNLKGIFRALIVDVITGSKAQGASTITQQLARNAFLSSDKSYERKIREIILAFQLERRYTKKEILEMYLNKVYFGSGAYGVQAASHVYFDQDVSTLNLAQCSLLAGLVQSPNRYSPFSNPDLAKKRQLQVLQRMVKCGYISPEEAQAAQKAPLKYASPDQEGRYEYGAYVDNVVAECKDILTKLGYDKPDNVMFQEGLRVYTGMNSDLQEYTEEIYANPKNFPSIKNSRGQQVESGMALIDPHNGEILALAGGRHYVAQRGFNRATMAKRQPGSSFKPLVVYAPALEAGYMPFTVLEDSLKTYNTGSGSWTPKNYDGVYRGPITMREAVKRSINTYAVKLADQVGIKNGIKMAEKMGISTLVKAGPTNDYNLSTALGGLTKGVTPLEMASALGVFANDGVYIKPHAITRIEDADGNIIYQAPTRRTRVMQSSTAWLMTSLLGSVVYDEGGTGHRAAVPGMFTAGKTGTTSDNKDAWFVGFTPYYACAVWMGFDHAEDLHSTFGGTYPALIFKQVMTKAVKGKPARQFTKPSTVTTVQVCSKSGLLPSPNCPAKDLITEYCVKGMEPKDTCTYNHTDGQPGSQTISICPDSGLLATVNCPHPVAKSVQDFGLNGPPHDYCSLHPGAPYVSSQNVKTRTVTICRDPRHHGQLFEANIPGEGEKGGCDPTNLETIQVPINTQIPHCDLLDHQVYKAQ